MRREPFGSTTTSELQAPNTFAGKGNPALQQPTTTRIVSAKPRTTLPCQAKDAPHFFSEMPSELEAAKRTCGQCPLQRQCLAGALARKEPWGVWGGEILQDGAIVAQKRARGRPPKVLQPQGSD